jgi:tartrate/fumarate subfamily iron-sulfur-dependent hydro-lyase beta chain
MSRARAVAAAIGVCAALGAARVAPAATDGCVSCHERDEDEEVAAAVPEWRDSVHFRAEVGCDGCHGGDPRAADEDDAHDEAAGWIGTPPWLDLPAFCDACHEAVEVGYASGAFGPTTAGRMDSYVDEFQKAGGSYVMLAKGNRSRAVTDACRRHGGFYLGSIGGPAARLAQDFIRKVEVLEYPELGMEAVWRIEVEDFPAFVVVDDKGNDFFARLGVTAKD